MSRLPAMGAVFIDSIALIAASVHGVIHNLFNLRKLATIRTMDKNVIKDAEKVIGREALQTEVHIIDYEAYEEWQRVLKSPLLNEKKMHTCSTGESVNLGNLPHRLRDAICELPEAEQKKIMLLKTAYNKLIAKATNLQKQAYGTFLTAGQTGTDKVVNKLDGKRADLIELFGRMFTLREVHEVCVKEWKLVTTTQALGEWRKEHIVEINQRIEEHKRSFSDIRLGYKRSRLEELVWLYHQRKGIYQMTKKAEDHRLLLDTLKTIKAEAEGDLIKIDATLEINLNDSMMGHLANEVFMYFPLKELILARVAAKSGLDVATVVSKIEHSYYAKQLNRDVEDADYEEVSSFPSNQTYDFDRIARIHKQKAAQEVVQKEQQKQLQAQQREKAKPAGQSLKEMLLAKLTEKQGDLNEARNTNSPNFIDNANK